MKSLPQAMKEWAWRGVTLFALALSLLTLAVVVIAIRVTAVPLLDDPDKTLRIVAREPGVAYDVLALCNDPTTKGVLGFPSEDGSPRRQLVRGQELVSWVDSGSNPNAMRYVFSVDGNQRSEAVEVTEAAAKCLRAKTKTAQGS